MTSDALCKRPSLHHSLVMTSAAPPLSSDLRPSATFLPASRTAVWRLNTVDRLYFIWFIALSVAVAFRHQYVFGWTGYLALHAGLVLGIGVLAWGAMRDRSAAFAHDWYPLLLFIVSFEEVARLSFLFVNHWQDDYLLRFEARLFAVPPTTWFSQYHSRALTELVNVGYFGYFLLLIVVGAALYPRREKRPFHQVMIASVLAYLLCYVAFLMFPTEGPAHTLSGRDTATLHGGAFYWAVLLIQNYAGVHGNAFPSSHVAAGMVALVFAWRYMPKMGAALTPIVLLLCAGAVYDRYHYLSDVVAGLAVGAMAASVVLAFQAHPERPTHQWPGAPPSA
jgi:membrane-associated phospholipid phosphatase